MNLRARSNARGRRGSTLVELVITTVLTVTFIYVVTVAFISFERAGDEVIARCSLAREADIAFTRMADDLRGTASSVPSRMVLSNTNTNEVWLIFNSSSTTVKYIAQNGQLIREVITSSNPTQTDTVVWSSVQGISAQQVGSAGNMWQIQLTLGTTMIENRSLGQTLSRTYTLVTVVP